MIEVVRYEDRHRPEWDRFIREAKNGVFLFLRDYMEYHADRFKDASVLFYEDGRLVAVMPANRSGSELHSHAGLTFGGVVSGPDMRAQTMLDVFDALKAHARAQGIDTVHYKTIPSIYHNQPSNEDLYALFRNDAVLVRRDLTSSVRVAERIRFSQMRERWVKKAKAAGLEVRRSDAIAEFMPIQKKQLEEKGRPAPVHTAEELERLARLFPDNIKLFAATDGKEMLGGTVIYESNCVAHAQYIASTEKGRKVGALDLVFAHLLEKEYAKKRWFDFGISTEKEGRVLNEGLVENKEGFGARSIVHDFYRMRIS